MFELGSEMLGNRQNAMRPPTAKTTEQPGASADFTVSCPRCGTANPAAAASCHRCHGELPKGGAQARDHASVSIETFRPLARPPRRLTSGVLAAAAVVVTILAAFGNYVYGILSYVDIPSEKGILSTPESSGVTHRRGAEDSGTIDWKPAAIGAQAPTIDDGVAPVAVPISSSVTVSQDAVGTLTNPQRTGPQTPGKAIVSPSTTVAQKTVEGARPGRVPCTERVRALGLCPAESVEERK